MPTKPTFHCDRCGGVCIRKESMSKPYYQDDSCTIYHGDCLDVMPTIPQWDAVVTDPPYGTGGCAPRGGGIAGTINSKSGQRPSWDKFNNEWISLTTTPIAAFCGIANVYKLAADMGADGLLIYVKSNPNPLGTSFEPCVTRGFKAPRGKQHVVAYNAFNGQKHPTQKPIEVLRWIISFAPLGLIIDPFMGSGTTLEAAKQLGRKAIGIELEEKYCEIAAERLQQEYMDFGNTLRKRRET